MTGIEWSTSAVQWMPGFRICLHSTARGPAPLTANVRQSMAYFPDLSSYAYANRVQPGVVHVGWLDGIHDYPKGIVPKHLIAKMKLMAKAPVELYRGFHICELCEKPEEVRRDQAQMLEAQRAASAKNENRPMRDFMSQLWAEWSKSRSSNGEIRIRKGDTVYAAPILIVHYIEEHGYLPPSEFLRALEAAAEPSAGANRPETGR